MRIVPRTEVGLASPRGTLTKAGSARKELYLHHSVTGVTGNPYADWRAVQNAAFGRGFSDISYTWGVHQDGTIMEGRSVHVVGAHTEGHNTTAHAICLIGNYDGPLQVTPQQLDAVRWLHTQIRNNLGFITTDHFDPHRTVKATACPGKNAYSRMAEFRVYTTVANPDPAPSTTGDFVNLPPTIAKGAQGQEVRNLQGLLASHAEDLAKYFSANDLDKWLDGVFGSNTEYVLAEWQKRTGRLTPDGICGPATWKWLMGVS